MACVGSVGAWQGRPPDHEKHAWEKSPGAETAAGGLRVPHTQFRETLQVPKLRAWKIGSFLEAPEVHPPAFQGGRGAGAGSPGKSTLAADQGSQSEGK